MADSRTTIMIPASVSEKMITDIKNNRILIRTTDGKLLEITKTKKVLK